MTAEGEDIKGNAEAGIGQVESYGDADLLSSGGWRPRQNWLLSLSGGIEGLVVMDLI